MSDTREEQAIDETHDLEIDFGIVMMALLNVALVGGALYSIIVDHIM